MGLVVTILVARLQPLERFAAHFQASMEVDGKLRESKLKTVSVGGLAMPDGKILHGFRGCIQVSLFVTVDLTQTLSSQKKFSFCLLVCTRVTQSSAVQRSLLGGFDNDAFLCRVCVSGGL